MANEETKFIDEILSGYLKPEDRDDKMVYVLTLSQFVIPSGSDAKKLFSNGFVVVGDSYVSAANPARHQKDIYRIGDNSDHPFYDFATSIAFERNEVPILPATQDVAEKIKESFGAVGLDGSLTEEQMPTSDIIPDPRQDLHKFIKVLVYRPKPGIADLYNFLASDD
jgi:hypothetical protein